MLTTIAVTAMICILSLALILVIPPFSSTKLFMRFLPQDVREAAKDHTDPPRGKRIFGYALTLMFAVCYIAAWIYLGKDGIRREYGFLQLFGRYLLFMYGYKIFDILVQDQYIVVSSNYFVRFFPETADCAGWNDRNFNRNNQIRRIISIPFFCAAAAWLTLFISHF